MPKSKKEPTFLRRKHAKLHLTSGHVSIHLEQSKTDTDAQGVDLLIFKGADGTTHCPVAAIVKAVGKFKRAGKLAHRDRPLFEDPTQKGTSVTRTQVISFLRTRLRAKGYDPADYCGHSCRKWAAQHARLPQKSQVVNCSRETALEAYRLGRLEIELQKVVDTCDATD